MTHVTNFFIFLNYVCYFPIILSLISNLFHENAFNNILLKMNNLKRSLSHSNFPPELWLLSSTDNPHVDTAIVDYVEREIYIDHSKSFTSCCYTQRQDGKLVDQNNIIIGAVVEINELVTGQNIALSLIGSVEWIVLNCTGSWTMIPVENVIAACDGSGTKLAVIVNQIDHLSGVIFSLELGPHAIVLPHNLQMWEKAKIIIINQNKKRLPPGEGNAHCSLSEFSLSAADIPVKPPTLQSVEITSIISGCIGDRVCIDLIQLLSDEEGCLIGSSAKALVFVHGETLSTEFVPARPFRVNAGPVHSYILMNDGSTKYLAEIQPGDTVLVARLKSEEHTTSGDTSEVVYTSRGVAVGRCKIERRPMLLVQFSSSSSSDSEYGRRVVKGQIFLQQAETVRISSLSQQPQQESTSMARSGALSLTQWRTLPVTQAAVGDKILLLTSEKGTHVGKRITAQVNEK